MILGYLLEYLEFDLGVAVIGLGIPLMIAMAPVVAVIGLGIPLMIAMAPVVMAAVVPLTALWAGLDEQPTRKFLLFPEQLNQILLVVE